MKLNHSSVINMILYIDKITHECTFYVRRIRKDFLMSFRRICLPFVTIYTYISNLILPM